jgi:hypothetical protein
LESYAAELGWMAGAELGGSLRSDGMDRGGTSVCSESFNAIRDTILRIALSCN